MAKVRGILRTLMTDPIYGVGQFFSRYVYRWVLKRKRGLRILGRIKLMGLPLIDIRMKSTITIDDNVTLNSCNRGYHVNMHSSVKLYTDHDGAEIYIGKNTRICGTCIHCYSKIHIGDNCLIAANSQIFDGNGHRLSFGNLAERLNLCKDAKPIIIDDDVWIGINCIILGGVTIGRGSVIAAGSVVDKEIPPFTIAGGNPARVIKTIDCVNDTDVPERNLERL